MPTSNGPPPPDAYPVGGRPGSALEMLGIGTVAIAGLYLAREIFVPLALAMLLSFALGPLVVALRRWHVGRVPSVIVIVVLAFLVILSIGSLVGSQLSRLAEHLPQYQSNITAKIHALQGTTGGGGVIGRASSVLKTLSREITGATQPTETRSNAASAPARGTQRPAPIPVEIQQPEPTALQLVETIVGPLLEPLATTGIVIVFLVFFLLQREDLRDRFIRLVGARDLHRTTRALDDAAHRLSRYLLTQTCLNAGFGVTIAVGLWVIGTPNPMLWGILAMLLRFVPYVGAVIAALFPAILALAVDPTWMMLLWTALLFAVVEPVLGQFVEPLVYGHGTGLSAVAVVVAAAFWTWLWGPVGLLLSTPLTLCLVVLGRHVDQLAFLDIALGDQPALSLEENFYQRLLANDPDEAAHQAEEFLKEHSLPTYYDEVAIKGLALAQADVNRGMLDHARRVQIKAAVADIIDDLSEHVDAPPEAAPAAQGPPTAPLAGAGARSARAVMCVAGRGSLDEAAAAMLAQLLVRRGIGAFVTPNPAASAANLSQLDVTGVQIVCLSYLEPGGYSTARFMVRRLRRKLPQATIVVGFWTMSEAEAAARDARRETGADRVVTSLRQAVDLLTGTAPVIEAAPGREPAAATAT